MSTFVKIWFFLTGVLAGKTILLGGKYQFKDGKMELQATPEEAALHARSLERNWSAFPQGHPRLELEEEDDNGQRDLSQAPLSNAEQTVQRGSESNGQGAPAGEPPANEGAGNDETVAGTGKLQVGGDGHAPELSGDAKPPINEKLKRAVEALDPKDDSHWIADGRPAIAAVSMLYGATDVTRVDVEAVAPGFTRPAKEA